MRSVGHLEAKAAAGDSVNAGPRTTPSTSLFAARDPFDDSALRRLVASNQDYQRSHGHYIVPLSERLLAVRRENDRLREAMDRADSELDGCNIDAASAVLREALIWKVTQG